MRGPRGQGRPAVRVPRHRDRHRRRPAHGAAVRAAAPARRHRRDPGRDRARARALLGLLPGNLPQVLFPADVRPYLTVIAQLGLVLFMFIVGLEVDLRLIQSRRRVATTVSLSSIALPFGLGVALAFVLYPAHSVAGPDAHTVPPLAFALFLGAAMSITAFPVLARILTERAHAPHPGRRAGAGLRGDRRRRRRGRCSPSSSRSRWAARSRASARSCCSPRCTRW